MKRLLFWVDWWRCMLYVMVVSLGPWEILPRFDKYGHTREGRLDAYKTMVSDQLSAFHCP